MPVTGARVVVDASAFAEYLLGTLGRRVAVLLDRADVHAPHLLVVETLSVLRGWLRSGQLTPDRAQAAVADLQDYPLTLWDSRPLAPDTLARRHNLSSYDATYAARAQVLDAPLLTTDGRLAAGAVSTLVHLVGLDRAPGE